MRTFHPYGSVVPLAGLLHADAEENRRTVDGLHGSSQIVVLLLTEVTSRDSSVSTATRLRDAPNGVKKFSSA
jgi:hypothetical protein